MDEQSDESTGLREMAVKSTTTMLGLRNLSAKSGRRTGLRSYRDVANEVRLRQRVLNALAEDKAEQFQPMFLTDTERELEKQKDVAVKNENKKTFKSSPTIDDDEIVEFVSKELTGKFLESKIFRTGIMAVIITNSLMIAIETDKKLERQYSHIFTVLDQCMMSVFVCEILTKWYHGFWKFWTQGWNILDFFIVASLLFGPLFLDESSGSRGVLRILRVLRAFRSLRGMSSLPGLQIVVQTILQSVPDMANIVLLLVIIMLVFSVIGITIFRHEVPKYFGNLSSAMFSLFICLTQDGWVEIFNEFEKKEIGVFIGGGLYLILFIAIGAFIFANLVVAVVVTNLECAVLDVRNEEQENAKEHGTRGLAEKDDNVKAAIISDAAIPTKWFKKQEPLFKPNFESLSVEQFENYMVIVSAMEDNYAEYLQIKQELIMILREVSGVNENAQIITGGEQSRKSTSTSSANSKGHATPMSGDIASGLMAMESSNFVSSRQGGLSEVIQRSAEAYVHKKFQKKLERQRK